MGFVAWLAQTTGSIALHESLHVYPIVESLHVLSIMLFAGTLIAIDLRLLGLAYPGTPAREVVDRLLPWTLAGFALLVLTGALLFYAIPVRTWHSVWFRLKLGLMLLAALNAWRLHWRMREAIGGWTPRQAAPAWARRAAALSLLLWALVIVAGRLIAYDWADCGRPQPGWVRWFAQCPEEGA